MNVLSLDRMKPSDKAIDVFIEEAVIEGITFAATGGDESEARRKHVNVE